MRALLVVLGFMALGGDGAGPGAADRPPVDAAMIARIMAVAEVDLQLRQAELGLIGSTLTSAREARRLETSPGEGARVTDRLAPPTPSPVREAVPASVSVGKP